MAKKRVEISSKPFDECLNCQFYDPYSATPHCNINKLTKKQRYIFIKPCAMRDERSKSSREYSRESSGEFSNFVANL